MPGEIYLLIYKKIKHLFLYFLFYFKTPIRINIIDLDIEIIIFYLKRAHNHYYYYYDFVMKNRIFFFISNDIIFHIIHPFALRIVKKEC